MCKQHSNSKAIITAKWMVCLDRLRARQSRAINVTADSMRRLRLIDQRWNRWEWHNDNSHHESRCQTISAAAFAQPKDVRFSILLAGAGDSAETCIGRPFLTKHFRLRLIIRVMNEATRSKRALNKPESKILNSPE